MDNNPVVIDVVGTAKLFLKKLLVFGLVLGVLLAIVTAPMIVFLITKAIVRKRRFLKKCRGIPEGDPRWKLLAYKFATDEYDRGEWTDADKRRRDLSLSGGAIALVGAVVLFVPQYDGGVLPCRWVFVTMLIVGILRVVVAAVQDATDPYYIPGSWEDPSFDPTNIRRISIRPTYDTHRPALGGALE